MELFRLPFAFLRRNIKREGTHMEENTTVRFAESGAHRVQMQREAAVEVKTDESTVLMKFPQDVLLTLDAHQRRIFFPAGVNQVVKSLADHPYLKAAGVERA
jgi:hypothetical protein